jgi:NAD dependent epimerase/dehydratase family enzyme
VPGFAIRARYGEMGSIVTTGARVMPRRLQQLGYEFRQPDLEQALRQATGKA